MNKTVRLFLVGMLASIPLIPAPADAVTYEIFAAAGNCAWDPSASSFVPGDSTAGSGNYGGGLLLNTARTSGEHRITCDFTQNVAASTQWSAWIYFYDNQASTGMQDDVYCNVYSCNMSGSTCTSGGTLFGTASGGTTTPGVFSGGDGYLNWQYINRSAFTTTTASCNVPGTSGGTFGVLRRFWVNWT